jgi:hypothetical protein
MVEITKASGYEWFPLHTVTTSHKEVFHTLEQELHIHYKPYSIHRSFRGKNAKEEVITYKSYEIFCDSILPELPSTVDKLGYTFDK